MKKLLLMMVLALVAMPAFAGHGSCNANLVSENVCRNEAHHVLYFDAPLAAFVELRDAIAGQQGWTPNMTCSAELVRMGLCTVGQLGEVVVVGKADFAEGWIKMVLRTQVVRQRIADAQEAAAQAVDQDVDVGD